MDFLDKAFVCLPVTTNLQRDVNQFKDNPSLGSDKLGSGVPETGLCFH